MRRPSSDDPFAAAAEAHAQKVAEHSRIRATADFQAAVKHMNRLINDFIFAIRSASIAFTRYPENTNWLIQYSINDLVQSAISIFALSSGGSFNVGKREMRYMIESTVKAVFVDETVPGPTPVADRLAIVGDRSQVPRSSVEVVDRLALRMLDDRKDFTDAVKSTYGKLSGFTHASKEQINETVRRFERGEFAGFESPATIRAFNQVLTQTFDLLLALVFEGIGPSFTGDIFVAVLDDRTDWIYHSGRFVSRVSGYFDYKHERQHRNY